MPHKLHMKLAMVVSYLGTISFSGARYFTSVIVATHLSQRRPHIYPLPILIR